MDRILIILQDFLVPRLAVSRSFSAAQLQEAARLITMWQLVAVVKYQIEARPRA